MSDPHDNKLLHRSELSELVRRERQAGQTMVSTNGCFDLLHVGHVHSLQEAKQHGDVLIVAINSDDSIRKLKGPSRPLCCCEHRVAMLAALQCVDYVTVFDEPTPLAVLEEIRPEVHVKGGGYSLDEIVGREFVESYGGIVKTTTNMPGVSTSSIIERILASSCNKEVS